MYQPRRTPHRSSTRTVAALAVALLMATGTACGPAEDGGSAPPAQSGVGAEAAPAVNGGTDGAAAPESEASDARDEGDPAPDAPPEPAADDSPAGSEAAPETAPGTAAERPAAVVPDLLFVEATGESGLDFEHFTGAFGEKYMPETVGSGGGFFDYDGDGDMDVLLVNGDRWPGHGDGGVATLALFANDGDGRFTEVTRHAGLDLSVYGMGAGFADYDADGDVDVYVTAVGDNLLLRNDGGRFTEVAAEAGVQGRIPGEERPIWSTPVVWTDYDGDGWLDLFVGNYVRWTPEEDRFTSLDGETKTYATPQVYPGETGLLYRNLGDGTFEDVTRQAGLWKEGKAMGAVAVDLDGRHGPDLVVTNDTEPNHLFMNRGDGTFEEVGVELGVGYDPSGTARAGMGVDVAHIGGGGEQAIAIGNFHGEALSLYTQAGGGFFEDQAGPRRLLAPTVVPLTFGVLWLDADLDGGLDLLTVNGHIEPEIARFASGVRFRQPAQLFLQGPGGTFAAAQRCGELCDLEVVGRGAATADVDGDGDLDLLITENDGPARLWRGLAADRGKAAVRVELRGDGPNWQAVGARVAAHAGDHVARREVRTGGSYLTQSDLALTFGLGEREKIDRLEIVWPSGDTRTVKDLAAGCTYRVVQGGGVEPTHCWHGEER